MFVDEGIQIRQCFVHHVGALRHGAAHLNDVWSIWICKSFVDGGSGQVGQCVDGQGGLVRLRNRIMRQCTNNRAKPTLNNVPMRRECTKARAVIIKTAGYITF